MPLFYSIFVLKTRVSMIILKHNNLIRIKNLASEFMDNSEDYPTVAITGSINCCKEQVDCSFENTIPTTEGTWFVDLDKAVKLNSIVFQLKIQSNQVFVPINLITDTINLGYVEQECTDDVCTLETYNSYFAPLFKSQIDDWFDFLGIVSDVSVSFDDNTLIIGDIPDGYSLISIETLSDTYYFGYGNVGSKVFITNGEIFVSPQFFGHTTLQDGVYKFFLKYIKEDGASFIQEENCAFIDVTTKCKVAGALSTLVAELKDKELEQTATAIYTLHYALNNGSNCACNCDELCEAYKTLLELLNTIDPKIDNNCGC